MPMVPTGEAIEFVRKLEDLEVKEGSSVRMTVELSTDKCNVVWHKDGQILDKNKVAHSFDKQGNVYTLVIENATVHHEGEYVVAVGEQECSCELLVKGMFVTQFVSKLPVTLADQVRADTKTTVDLSKPNKRPWS